MLPILTSELEDVPDVGIKDLLRDLYRQKRDAREVIDAIAEDVREILFYVYVHRPNLAISELARQVGVHSKTFYSILSHHDGFVRMKSKGQNKHAKGANMPNLQYVHDSNLELVTMEEAMRNAK